MVNKEKIRDQRWSAGNPGDNLQITAGLILFNGKFRQNFLNRASVKKNQLYFPGELCIINKIFILYTKNKKMKDEEENLSILEGNKGCYLQLSR